MLRKKNNEIEAEDINAPEEVPAAEDTEYYEPDMIFDNEIEQALFEYCDKYGIEDMSVEPQARWTSALKYIHDKVFDGKKQLLKRQSNINNKNAIMSSTYNSYNYDLILKILDYYIFYMCLTYNKEISIIGFSALTGIDYQVIYEWGNNNKKLSTKSYEVYQKLQTMREESLSGKLNDTNIKNYVGIIAKLNRLYGWASPYTSDSNRQAKPLTSEQLPQFGNNKAVPQIEQPKE